MPGALASRAVAACVSSISRIYLVFRAQAKFEQAPPRKVYVPRSKGQTTCQDHNLQNPLPLYRWETNRSAYALATAAKAALQGGLVGG